MNSTNRKEDVGGMVTYAGGFKDGVWHGHGASYDCNNGKVFVGEWEGQKMKEGVTSYLSRLITRTLYKEIYNDQDQVDAWWQQTPCSKVKI